MAFNFIWLSGDPEVEKYVQKANEERAAAFHATFKLVGRAVSAPGRRLFGSIQHARRVRQTRRELSALSDHLLRDIGIGRGDIPVLAKSMAARAPKSGLTLEQLRRAEAKDPSGNEIRAIPVSGNVQTRPADSQATAPQPVDRRPAEHERFAA